MHMLVFAKDLVFICMHTVRAHEHIIPCAHVHVYVWVCVHVSISGRRGGGGVGLEAGRAHRSAREGGSLQLSLQLPTGCEGHWCDSTNYRQEASATNIHSSSSAGLCCAKPILQQPLYTSHPSRVGRISSVMPKWDIIHTESSERRPCFDLQDVEIAWKELCSEPKFKKKSPFQL